MGGGDSFRFEGGNWIKDRATAEEIINRFKIELD